MSESSTIIREVEAQERIHIQQTFQEAALDATQMPLMFLDPTRFNGDPEHDKQSFKEQFQEQHPDSEIPWSDYDIEDSIEYISESSRTAGPWAMKPEYTESDFCIVNGMGQIAEENITTGGINLTTKEGIVSFLAGVEPNKIHPIPGTTDDYVPYIAEHEIAHCEQPSEMEAIAEESDADQFANQGATSAVIQTVADARAYDAYSDTDHATNILSKSNDISAEDIETHRDTILAMDEEIDVRMAREFGEDTAYSQTEINAVQKTYDTGNPNLIAEMLREEDRGLYHDTIDRMLADGGFDDDPLLKEYVEDQQIAARRLVKVDEIGLNDGPDTVVEETAIEYVENGAFLDDDGNPIRDDVSLPERDENGRILHDEDGDIILGDSVNEAIEAQAQESEQEPEVEQAANTAEESTPYSEVSFEQQSTGNELENINPQLAGSDIESGTINASLTTVFEENVLAANDAPITELQQPAPQAAPTAMAFTG